MENIRRGQGFFAPVFLTSTFYGKLHFAGIMPQRPSIRFNYLKQEGNKTGFRLYNLLLALIYLEEASTPLQKEIEP